VKLALSQAPKQRQAGSLRLKFMWRPRWDLRYHICRPAGHGRGEGWSDRNLQIVCRHSVDGVKHLIRGASADSLSLDDERFELRGMQV
jgi:hypothetical protein